MHIEYFRFPAYTSSAAVENLLKKGRSLHPVRPNKKPTMAPDMKDTSKTDATHDTTDLPQTLLNLLAERGSVDSLSVAAELHQDHQKIVGAVNSLLALPNVRFFISS